MAFSRRKFLQHSSLAALACATPWRAWSENTNAPGSSSPLGHITGKASNLTRQALEGAVGSSFKVSTVDGNGQAAWLILAAVHDLPALTPVNAGSMAVPPPRSSSPPVSTEGFMLSFAGGPSTGLAQGTYVFQHDVLGTLKIFIVPAGMGVQSYTAVFNEVSSAVATPAPPSQLPGRARPDSTPRAGGSGVVNEEGSPTGQPAQEPLDPVFGHPLKSKLPE